MPAPDDPRTHGPGATSARPVGARQIDDVSTRPTIVLPRQRGVRRPDPRGRKGAPLPVAAVANGLWAAILTFIPVLTIVTAVTQIGAQRPPFFETFRYGLAAWLLSYGVPLRLSDYPVALVPLLVTVFAWWRVARAGRNTVRGVKARGRGSWSVTAGAAVAIAMLYALLGLGCAVLVNGSGVSVSPVRASLTLALFAGVSAALGAGAATSATRRLWWRAPAVARDGVRAGVVSAVLLIGAGALVAGVAVAAASSRAADMLHSYHAGVTGQAALIAICLVYAPNVAVWATAFVAGPGFTLVAVPALPVFAGLPSRPVTGAAQLLLAVPVLAGVGAGILLVRKSGVAGRALANWRMTLLVAALAGVSSAACLGAAGYVAAGSLGVSLLADMGQVGWQFPAISGVGIGVGCLIGLNTGRLRVAARSRD